MRRYLATALLCIGCASSPAKPESQPPRIAPSAEPAPSADPRPTVGPWVNTAEYVKGSTGRWTGATIVDGASRTELAMPEVQQVAEIVAGCAVSDGWAATTPPWPAAVIEARAGDEVVAVFQLQVHGVRVDAAQPYQPSLASIHSDEGPSVQDCDIEDDDDQLFLEALHARVLGGTKTREFEAPPQPWIE